jgi:hypothetical protein
MNSVAHDSECSNWLSLVVVSLQMRAHFAVPAWLDEQPAMSNANLPVAGWNLARRLLLHPEGTKDAFPGRRRVLTSQAIVLPIG